MVADTDADGLSDSAEENIYNTNPYLTDTDGDGLSDLFEISNGYYSHIENTTWSNALVYAKSNSSVLAMIKTQADFDAASEYVSSLNLGSPAHTFWVGAYNPSNQWTFIDGTSFLVEDIDYPANLGNIDPGAYMIYMLSLIHI